MSKRGQITTFVIIGIIVVAAIAFIFFARGAIIETLTKAVDVEKQLEIEMTNIKNHVEDCLEEKTREKINLVLDKGGYFDPVNVISYHGEGYTVLCQNIEDDDKCLSNPLIIKDVENRLNKEIENGLKTCIDLNKFRKDVYELSYGEMNLSTEIKKGSVITILNFPVNIKRDEFEFSRNEFVKISFIPLGEIIEVVNDVIDTEARFGKFDPLSYSILSFGKYEIVVKKPYPNKIYTVKLRDYPYVFSFSVEGESRFE